MAKSLTKPAFLAVLALLPAHALAWSEHHLITRAALSKVPGLSEESVQITPFADLIKALGHASELEFNKSIKIRKQYRFDFKKGEVAGQRIPAIDVISHYSDEPDWDMDKELFDDDQYPELWKDEYSMMGGKEGTPSQSFRHMFWRGFHVLHPLRTFKLPLKQILKSMGEAPQRAELFLGLARQARSLGHEYWAMRFIANALHYLEDVSQPFHATQTPSKVFITLPFVDRELGSGMTDFVPQLTNIIAYYHFAYEDYVGLLMEEAAESPASPGRAFADTLASPSKSYSKLRYQSGKGDKLVEAMANMAVAKASSAAKNSIAFFPNIKTPYKDLNPKQFMDGPWWKSVTEKGRKDSKAKKKYFETVNAMFDGLGEAVRSLVTTEVPTGEAE